MSRGEELCWINFLYCWTGRGTDRSFVLKVSPITHSFSDALQLVLAHASCLNTYGQDLEKKRAMIQSQQHLRSPDLTGHSSDSCFSFTSGSFPVTVCLCTFLTRLAWLVWSEQRVEWFLLCLRGIAQWCVHIASFNSTETLFKKAM